MIIATETDEKAGSRVARPTREQAALGAVLGALVGDAAGAVLEFFRKPIEATDVAHAMTMPGGGTWGVAPGQVTDDGELTMSLLVALAEAPDPERPTEAAALRYAQWASSRPFDIGSTTAASLGCLLRDPELADCAKKEGVASVMTATARRRCMQSKANGSLMRATPLAVWGAGAGAAGRGRDPDAVALATMMDARLSHPNDACVGAAVAYVLAIRHLIIEPGDVAGAIARATGALQVEHFAEPRAWLTDAINHVVVPYKPQDGFARIAFTHAFRHLVLGTHYEQALRETLAGGGDTDTNACIVGGLLGARWGAGAIPEALKRAVLESNTTGPNAPLPRPAELHPRSVPQLVQKLIG